MILMKQLQILFHTKFATPLSILHAFQVSCMGSVEIVFDRHRIKSFHTNPFLLLERETCQFKIIERFLIVLYGITNTHKNVKEVQPKMFCKRVETFHLQMRHCTFKFPKICISTQDILTPTSSG